MDLEQLTDLLLLSGIAGCLVLGGYYGLVKVRNLFIGYRGLKTQRTLTKMTERSPIARFMHRWWKRPSASELREKSVVEFLLACDQGRLDEVKRLVARGVGVDVTRAKGGKTGLVRAARNGHADVVRYLIKIGADVNATGGRSDKSPLMRAVERGDLALVQVLLGAGANVNAKNRFGETAIDIAYKRREEALVELLRAYGANSSRYVNEDNAKRPIDETEGYYAILNCQRTDTIEAIRAQYRKLIKQYHPDVIQGKGLPADFVQFANEKFRRIQEAYQHITKKQRGQ